MARLFLLARAGKVLIRGEESFEFRISLLVKCRCTGGADRHSLLLHRLEGDSTQVSSIPYLLHYVLLHQFSSRTVDLVKN